MLMASMALESRAGVESLEYWSLANTEKESAAGSTMCPFFSGEKLLENEQLLAQ